MQTIGFIGLGAMGKPMARNLLAAGYPLVIHSRRPDVREEMTKAGALAVQSPAAVAHRAEVVITIVTADPQVREVWAGDNGLIAGAAAGRLLIDMSTIAPTTIRELADLAGEKGISVLDAPVSGGPSGAAKGTLAIMVGGAEDDLVRARPILDVLGRNVFHMGAVGAGQAAKLCNQLLAGGTMVLIAEALLLGRESGLDLDLLAEAIGASSGNSAVFGARVRKFVLQDRFEPGFALELMQKDMELVVALGRREGIPTPLAARAAAAYALAAAGGLGQQDFSAVFKAVERPPDPGTTS